MSDYEDFLNKIIKPELNTSLVSGVFLKRLSECKFIKNDEADYPAFLNVTMVFTNPLSSDEFEDMFKAYKTIFTEFYTILLNKAHSYITENLSDKYCLKILNEEDYLKELERTLSYIECIFKGQKIGDINTIEYLNDVEPDVDLGEKYLQLEIIYSISITDNENEFNLLLLGNDLTYWEINKEDKTLADLVKFLLILDEKPKN